MIGRTVRGDQGVSLIELIVGVVVSGVVMGLIAVAFANGSIAQKQALARDSATSQANVVRASLQASLRNATSVRVSGGGTRVDAAVARVGGSMTGWMWECHAWVLVDESVRFDTGTGPRVSSPTGWVSLAGRSTQRPLDTVKPTSGSSAFTLVGSKGVQIGVQITAGTDPQTVSIADGMTAQAVATEGATACW